MSIKIKPTMVIDTNLLIKQRALIGTLIGSLTNGRTGFAIKCDLDTLLGIQGILDTITDSADFTPPADDFEGPECPGCTHPGNCEDCEYDIDQKAILEAVKYTGMNFAQNRNGDYIPRKAIIDFLGN